MLSEAGQLRDDFRGDDPHLIDSIVALLALDARGALVPHGIGGHARALLSAAAVRLAARAERQSDLKGCGSIDCVRACAAPPGECDFERAERQSDLLGALKPFADVAEFMRPLGAFENWPDDKPNSEFIPGAWPRWAAFRKAAELIAEETKTPLEGWRPTQAEIAAIAERWIYRTAHNGSAHLCNGIAKDVLALFTPAKER